jgi:tetratricopeptide (TPR) repeat protein
LKSTEVCWFPAWLRYFAAVLVAIGGWRGRSSSAGPRVAEQGAWRSSASQTPRLASQGEQSAIGSRGQTYQAMGRYDDALTDFNRLIELGPDDEGYAAKQAELYQLMGEGSEDTSIEQSSLERPSET